MEPKPVRFYIIHPPIKEGPSMEIAILGSGTCVPSLKRGSPGLILRIGERILLFDSGTGTIERMLKRGITYLDLDVVLYTHTHPDHTAGKPPKKESSYHRGKGIQNLLSGYSGGVWALA
jgi:ribonuclease BN (tRNA processing enzyme)